MVFFPPFFKYHALFQDQLEGYMSEDGIIDMIKVIVLKSLNIAVCYIVLRELHHRKCCEYLFFLTCRSSSKTQSAITYSTLTIKTLEQGVKYDQS